MPRAKAVNEPEMGTPKVSRPRRTSTSGEAPKRAPRRKAPTVIATPPPHKRSPKMIMAIAIGFLAIIGSSTVIGMTDSGQINVASVISERGQTLRDEGKAEEADKLIIPKDERPRPNGGLTPQSADAAAAPVPPAPEPSTLGASSTQATSTDAIVAPEGEAESATDDPAAQEAATTPPPPEASEATPTE